MNVGNVAVEADAERIINDISVRLTNAVDMSSLVFFIDHSTDA